MVNIIKSWARRQLVGLLNLLQSPDGQEHANRRAQGKEVHWLKVQRVVDHRHLRRKNCPLSAVKKKKTSKIDWAGQDGGVLPARCRLQSSCS